MGISVPFYFGVQTSIYQIKIQGGIPGQGAVIVRQYQHGGNAAGACSVRSLAGPLGIENWFLISGGATLGIAVFALTLPALRHCMDG